MTPPFRLALGFLLLVLVACGRQPLPLAPLAPRVSTYQPSAPPPAEPVVPMQLVPLLPRPAPIAPDKAVVAGAAQATYERAYQQIAQMLDGRSPLSFKRAVFLTENAYFNEGLDYGAFCVQIAALVQTCRAVEAQTATRLLYDHPDKAHVVRQAVLFRLLCDTTRFQSGRVLYPFRYDFTDFNGAVDWRQMFVTKLLVRHTGNCHSLPFLYKILADELGTPTWLALAPNHLYLKQHNRQQGWYNTELTSGTFPNDAWLMASGYISKETIVSGIYMDTLTARHNVALCLVDLAKGYERQLGPGHEAFVLRCTDLALRYFPHYINALLLRADALRRQFERQPRSAPTAAPAYAAMEAAYTRIFETGYREIPPQMYAEWLRLVQQEKAASPPR